jgi:outer membrane receptor protein involved in Fe transport
MRYITFILLFFVHLSIAQQKKSSGTISGIILDGESKQPIEFCTITLMKQADSSIVTGVLSNDKGLYTIEQIKNGNYYLKISFVGYENFYVNKVVVDETNFELKVRPVMMKLKMMKTIEVVADKATMQLEPDKKVFNVEKSIISQGGTAADVLKNVPTINVDAEGNMNLRGGENITIYIDGKQSAQMSSNPTQALQQLPAGMIEKVEIITNPSSKYEASGSTGIINIITKKSSQQGWNGSITAGFGDNDKFNKINKFNEGLLLNYQKGKLNFFASYNHRYDTRTGYGIMNQTIENDTVLRYLNNSSTSLNLNRTHAVKGSIDYNISNNLTVGASLSKNFGLKNDGEDYVYYNIDVNNDTLSKYKRGSYVKSESNNLDAAVFIKKTFKKQGQSIGLDANYSDNQNQQTTDYSDYLYNINEKFYYNNPIKVNVTQPTRNKVFNIQSDYSDNFKNVKFETGLRYTNRIIDNTFTQDTISKINTGSFINNFIYNDIVSAAYTSASSEIKSFKVKAGLRAENTSYYFDQKTLGTKYSRTYFNLFPTASISRKLKYEIDFSASYSMRINRPSANQLNALPDISNPTNTMVGNPNLKPTITHAIEATFSKYFGSQFLLGTLYYRRQLNNIQRYVSRDKFTNANTITFINLNNSTNSGIEIVSKNQITKKTDVTSNINLFQQQLNGTNIDSQLSNNVYAGTFRLILNTKLPKEISMQITASLNTPTRSLLGKIKPMNYAEIGFRKDFFNRKLSTSISFNDVFNTLRFRINVTNPVQGFSRYMERKRETRIIQVSLNYRFGQGDNKKVKQQLENQDRQGGGSMDMM